jgi:cysteine desulfurase / selenocysteine lyase
MNIAELHQNEALRKHEFPVCEQKTFLAHAGVCPIPSRVQAAMAQYIADCTKGDQEDAFPHGRMLETRKLSAQLLKCRPDEIALIGPTSLGLSLVANGIDWKSGDNVVFYADDYPSNVVPWMALQGQGVETRMIQPRAFGQITLEDIRPLVDDKTRLVALASAHFVTGFRLNIDEIGEWVRSRGVLFSIDGIQTVGAISTSVAHVDFLAADAHKWLLGPCAIGIFYVRKESQEKLRPTLLGWNNVDCPGYVMPSTIEFPKHAGRYEAGSPNLIGVVALHAAITMLLEVGLNTVEETILSHTQFLRESLVSKNFDVANDSDRLTGITSFRKENFDLAALHRKLNAANIFCSLRQTRDGKKWIRFSPHFYNTRTELGSVVELI